MAYGDFKDLPKRTASDKVLRDKAFSIAKNLKYDGYQRGLALLLSNSNVKSKTMPNQELAEELHKSIIRIFESVLNV